MHFSRVKAGEEQGGRRLTQGGRRLATLPFSASRPVVRQGRDANEAPGDAHGAVALRARGHARQPLDHAKQALVVFDQAHALVQRRSSGRAICHVERHFVDRAPLSGYTLPAAHRGCRAPVSAVVVAAPVTTLFLRCAARRERVARRGTLSSEEL